MKKFLSIIFSKLTFVLGLFTLQVLFFASIVYYFNQHFLYIYAASSLISFGTLLFLINKKEVPEIKMSWVVCILALPLFGITLYFLIGEPILNKKYKKNLKESLDVSIDTLKQDDDVFQNIKKINTLASTQTKYILNASNCPVYQNTSTEYLKLGEVKQEALLRELKNAKHYIFLQYFIIEEGKMWGEILEILKEKAATGVDVRVLYDDAGCAMTLPNGYHKKLEKMGIKCGIINPMSPRLNIVLQNRDHRKIVVIDGLVGFTGGINLADEYINAKVKHGHWKDCAVMLKGNAVMSLAAMFLQTWNFTKKTTEELSLFEPKEIFKTKEKGFVQPYTDTPHDTEYTAQIIYQNILNHACDYVYVNSPYFIVDDEVLNAFLSAAKRGIDVRLVLPHIADKWYVHIIARSYYKQLIQGGIKVYEYTPGFIHSKTFVSDDTTASIGTVNLDYRSLYHHFECGVWMYNSDAVMQLKEDYLETLKVCQEMTIEDCNKIKWYKRAFVTLVKIFAPML